MGTGRGEGALRVLLVEDNVDVADSLSVLLELDGHQVDVAGDGGDALETARRRAPDIVLCDIGLPGTMDGYAVARAFREDPRLSGVTLVAVTGYAQPSDRDEAAEAGFDAHLSKPVELTSLRRLFGRLRG